MVIIAMSHGMIYWLILLGRVGDELGDRLEKDY